jgi:tetratricopeptide (TPR) repeat protein
MGKKNRIVKGVLGLSAIILVFVFLWIGLMRQRQQQGPVGESGAEDVGALDINQLIAYIRACEEKVDFQKCEQAYQRGIRLTHGKKSRFQEFIDFKFGLAELYMNSLWEYGQFGGEGKIPPALNRAMEIYDEIIASYPGSETGAEAQYRKGEIFHNEFSGYWNTLHLDDAIREFQMVIDRYPGTDQARRAKEKMASLAFKKGRLE